MGTHAVEAVAGRLLDPATSAATERAAAAAARSSGHSSGGLFSRLFRRGGSRTSQPAAVTATAAATASSHAAASAVGHAGEAAAVHGGGRGGMGVVDLAIQRVTGSRLGRRLLTPQLLSRVGRGAMVALPAVGALFVAHLAHQVGMKMRLRALGMYTPDTDKVVSCSASKGALTGRIRWVRGSMRA